MAKYEGAKKAKLTRQRIIEVTAPIFNKKGYVGTSMTDLTAATGLTKGSLYGNFKNKDEIAVAAFQHNFDFMLKVLREAMGKEETILQKFQALTDAYRDLYPDFLEKGGCPVLNTGVDAADVHEPLRVKAQEAILVMLGHLKALLVAGMKRGEFQTDLDIDRWAGVIYSTIQGGIFMTKATNDVAFLGHALDEVDALILRFKK